MKLYIKQKVFSIGAKFHITDENGENRYRVEGEVFTLGKKLHKGVKQMGKELGDHRLAGKPHGKPQQGIYCPAK